MIEYIIIAWLSFCLGFAFSFTTTGAKIGYAMLAKVDEILPKKEKKND